MAQFPKTKSAVTALLLLLVVLAHKAACQSAVASSLAGAAADDSSDKTIAQAASTNPDPFTRRQTVFVDVGTGKPFPLKLPRLNPLPPGNPATAVRLRVNDTCGVFTLFHTVHQPAGAGPPPHLHYAEDEFFIVSV